MSDGDNRGAVVQAVIVQVVVAALAGFLGTVVGVEVVKERVAGQDNRIARLETRVDALEGIQTKILTSQVEVLTTQLQLEPGRHK